MAEGVAVKVTNLEKSFHSTGVITPALRGINLEVNAGELLMLVGPSGCGKTTLISCIAAILTPDKGICEVFGQNLSKLTDSQKTRFRGKEIGFIFQSFNLIPTLSTIENVSVPLLLNGKNRKEAEQKAAEVLTRVGLGARLNSLPSELSGGQQQRVAIARALVHNPRLIVADEPTSALDHANGQKIMELFREVALAEGRSLIIVTHDARIFPFADRIATMEDGRIIRVAKEENGHS